MKNYNINKMLDEWGSSSIASQNPFPNVGDPEDVEDLTTDDGSKVSPDLATNFPGPSDPENRPGPDKKKLNIEEADELEPKPSKPDPLDMKMNPSMMGSPPPGGAAGMDPSMMGMDPSMMGMGMPTGPASSQEVGRIYELKKIYSRLVSMQSYLAGSTDVNLIKLRNYVSNTIDLFRTLISNIALYKDNMDDIIVTFYKVVDNVYVILSKYYKDNTTGNDIMVRAIE